MINEHRETCGCIVTEVMITVIQNGDTPMLDITYDTLANVVKKNFYPKND